MILPLGGPTTRLLKLLGVNNLCPSLLGFLSLFLFLFLFLSLLLSLLFLPTATSSFFL